jgi:hypothetical protein
MLPLGSNHVAIFQICLLKLERPFTPAVQIVQLDTIASPESVTTDLGLISLIVLSVRISTPLEDKTF